jgi:hypothetical protein
METPVSLATLAASHRPTPAPSHPAGRLRALCLALAAALPAAVVAQEAGRSPWYVGGSVSLAHDSNPLRVSSESARSDTISTVTLLGGFDQPISRQRLFGDLSLSSRNYSNASRLNSVGYGAALGLDWSTIGRLSGTLRLDARQQQAEFSGFGLPVIDTRNDERTAQFQAIGRWGMASLFQVEASYATARLDYSNELAASRGLEQQAAGLGLRYSPSAFLSVGVGGRVTDGRYPRFYAATPGSGSPLDFDRRDIDFTIGYTPTGLTRLEARLSSTQVDYQQDPTRDVSAATGSLTWTYRPSGRIGLSTTLFRETGAASTFLDLGAAGRTIAGGSTSTLANGLRLGATYDLTGKIRLDANVAWTDRDYRSTPGGSEQLLNYGLGATWAYSRSVQFACGLQRETRDANGFGLSDFSATIVQCSAQMVLR